MERHECWIRQQSMTQNLQRFTAIVEVTSMWKYLFMYFSGVCVLIIFFFTIFCLELHFAKGELDDAKTEFKKAMKCDESNPTPYVNSALAIMNTPPSGTAMVPDFGEAVSLLEKAVEVDPMFHSAYVQLGQIKLSIATDLTKAREVVELYDRGLEYCRTPEELKDICSMRILTMAQIDAAEALRMETLNMQ